MQISVAARLLRLGCATLREDDVEQKRRELARQVFAINEINFLETLNRATNQGAVGSIAAGRANIQGLGSENQVLLSAVGPLD